MAQPDVPRYRVMIVDDSAAIRSSLRELLADIAGVTFEVVEALDGVAALKKLGTDGGGVDLVICLKS